jgi:hypothetical protein
MSKPQEALKMAIEVMTERGWYADKRCSDLIQTCKEALAECEQQAEPEYIHVEFTEKKANLDFTHLFDKGLTGKYKILLEKTNEY